MKKLTRLSTTTTVLCALATAAAGCGGGGSGSRKGGDPVYGPGTTGSTGTTTGGVTPGTTGVVPLGTFSSAPALNDPRTQPTATTLTDGRVLVTGGSDGSAIYKTSEIFDPLANAWTTIAAPAGMMTFNGVDTARQLHTATLLADGRVLIAGGLGVERLNGQAPAVEAITSAFIFDPVQNAFLPAGAMPTGRMWHSATLLGNNRVLVAGGMDAQLATVRTAAVFNPADGTWTNVTPGSSDHTFGSLVTAQGQTLFVGGCQTTNNGGQLGFTGVATPTVEVFDPVSNTFGAGPTNAGDRLFMGSNVLPTGQAFFAGGQGASGTALANVDLTELYDPATNTFTAGPTLSRPVNSCEVASLGNSGDQLIVGGIEGQGASATPSAVCEVYQASTNTIAGQVNMATARVDHRVVTLLDGRVMVIGGEGLGAAILDTCEFHTR